MHHLNWYRRSRKNERENKNEHEEKGGNEPEWEGERKIVVETLETWVENPTTTQQTKWKEIENSIF